MLQMAPVGQLLFYPSMVTLPLTHQPEHLQLVLEDGMRRLGMLSKEQSRQLLEASVNAAFLRQALADFLSTHQESGHIMSMFLEDFRRNKMLSEVRLNVYITLTLRFLARDEHHEVIIGGNINATALGTTLTSQKPCNMRTSPMQAWRRPYATPLLAFLCSAQLLPIVCLLSFIHCACMISRYQLL